MKRVTKIRQRDEYDCGAASLLSIAEWYGINVSLSKIRRVCGCTPEGITIQGIIDGAKSIGINAKALKIEPKRDEKKVSEENKILALSELEQLESPTIAHIIKEDGYAHFVVIERVKAGQIFYMDPAEAESKKETLSLFAQKWSGYVILFAYNILQEDDIDIKPIGAEREKKDKSKRINRKKIIYRSIKYYKRELILALIGSICLTIIGVCYSLFLQNIIDNIIPKGDRVMMAGISLLIVAMIPIIAVVSYNRSMYLVRSGLKLDAKFVLGFLNKIFNLPVSFFKEYKTGDLESRISDIYKIKTFLTEGILSICICIMTLLIVAILMFTYYWKLSLCMIAYIPLYIVVYYFLNKRNKKYKRDIAVAGAKFESSVIDCLEGAQTLKYYYNENRHSLYASDYAHLIEQSYSGAKHIALFEEFGNGVSHLLISTIIIIGGIAIFSSNLTIGELVSFYTLSSFFISPMNQIVEINSLYNDAVVASDRILDIVEEDVDESREYDMREIDGNKAIEIIKANRNKAINFRNIEFRYAGREMLLKDFSSSIKLGKINLIKGKNGTGKSTLLSLLTKDYIPQSGKITIDKIDIDNFGYKSWRQLFGIANQQVHLFNATILDNITCHDSNPDLERVAQICSELGIDEMVEKFPQGITTLVGSKGQNLSGGQMQKISIARMLYKDPEIYILDEATSYMDPEAEKRVMAMIYKLQERGKTIIVVSHRGNYEDIAENIISMS